MSMTRGPIVPCRTGSSYDLPVSLSVRVMLPLVKLSPSIAAPLSHHACGSSSNSDLKIDPAERLGKRSQVRNDGGRDAWRPLCPSGNRHLSAKASDGIST